MPVRPFKFVIRHWRSANCELVRRSEAKIKTTIDRVWGAA